MLISIDSSVQSKVCEMLSFPFYIKLPKSVLGEHLNLLTVK